MKILLSFAFAMAMALGVAGVTSTGNKKETKKVPIAIIKIYGEYVPDRGIMLSDSIAFDPTFYETPEQVRYSVFERVALEYDRETLFYFIEMIKRKQESLDTLPEIRKM